MDGCVGQRPILPCFEQAASVRTICHLQASVLSCRIIDGDHRGYVIGLTEHSECWCILVPSESTSTRVLEVDLLLEDHRGFAHELFNDRLERTLANEG